MNRKTLLWIETILQIAIIAVCLIDGWASMIRVSGTTETKYAASFYDVSGGAETPVILCAISVILLSWKLLPVKIPYILPLGFQTIVCIGVIINIFMPRVHRGMMLPLGYVHIMVTSKNSSKPC